MVRYRHRPYAGSVVVAALTLDRSTDPVGLRVVGTRDWQSPPASHRAIHIGDDGGRDDAPVRLSTRQRAMHLREERPIFHRPTSREGRLVEYPPPRPGPATLHPGRPLQCLRADLSSVPSTGRTTMHRGGGDSRIRRHSHHVAACDCVLTILPF